MKDQTNIKSADSKQKLTGVMCKMSVVKQKPFAFVIIPFMLYLFFITNFLLFTTNRAISQNVGVGINTAGAPADNSAILDVSSTSQGTLIPRMTTTQRNLISSPVNSLLIFNTTTNCYEWWNALSSAWVSMSCGTCPVPSQPSAITGTGTVCQNQSGVAYSVTNVAGLAYSWTYSGAGIICASGCTTYSITVNYTGSATSGTLTVTPSNVCGSGPASTLALTVNSLPVNPSEGTHTPTQTAIIWNWSTVSGATGYQWNTSNTYPGVGVNVVASPTYTQTSLICNTAYNLYVWAYNSCGNSTVYTTLSQTTSSCCSVNCSGSGNIGTFAGNGVGNYGGDGGSALCASIQYPQGLVFDGSGNIYIADMGNFRVRKVNTAGTISTFAGGNLGFGGDGGAATAASLSSTLFGIALDQSGNMYICDRGNQVVRKINTAGTISTFAGQYNFSIGGYSGDGGQATAALLDQPWDVAIDGSGNVYIADKNNDRIRKVTVSTGIISTFAGNGIRTYSGDGGAATNASIAYPSGVTIDASGNVYISDNQNNRIRKVNTSGNISTFAGKGTAGYHYTGDGGAATAAEISTPGKIAIDGSGNVYIPDGGNQVVRKVNTSGNISTFAGFYPGNYNYSGDGGPATNAEFRNPYFVAIDASGNVYISDYSNNRVRKVCK